MVKTTNELIPDSTITSRLCSSRGFISTRYPASKRKLSDKDIQELDKLFDILNISERYTRTFDETQNRIDVLLGYKR